MNKKTPEELESMATAFLADNGFVEATPTELPEPEEDDDFEYEDYEFVGVQRTYERD